MDGYHFPGDAFFRGENRPYGALITYVVNEPKGAKDSTAEESVDDPTRRETRGETADGERPDGREKKRTKFEVLDGTGTLIRTFEGPMTRGINRVAWNLRRDGFKRPQLTPHQGEGFGGRGPEVPPGKYTIRVKLGKQEASQTVEILPDPRLPVAVEAQQQKYNLILAVVAKLEVAAEAVNRIQKTRAAIEIVIGQIKDRKDEAATNRSFSQLLQKGACENTRRSVRTQAEAGFSALSSLE